jgi:hypothetical protein
MNTADQVIRWSAVLTVLGVAVVAAVVSYEHASALVRAHGKSGWTGRLIPLTVDGWVITGSPTPDIIRRQKGLDAPSVGRGQAPR